MESLVLSERARERALSKTRNAQGGCLANIPACLIGDMQAWREFVRLYGPLITKVADWTLRRAGAHSASETDDVAQEVFARLVRGNYRLLESWDSARGSFSTWLTVVSRSTALDYLRDKRNGLSGSSRHVPLDDYPEIPAHIAPEGERLTLPEGILSPRQRAVLFLQFEKDMTPEEIAAFLDIHPQTVRSVRHSAYLKLRDYYKNNGK